MSAMPSMPTLLRQFTEFACPTFTEQLAAYIRKECGRRGISRSHLGTVLGLSQTTMTRVWHGKRTFTVTEIAKAGALFGLTPVELFTIGWTGSEEQTTGRRGQR